MVEFDWQIEPEGSQPGAPPPSPDRRWVRWILLSLLIALGLGSAFWRWREGQLRKLAQIEKSVMAVVRLEISALAHGDSELYLGLQDETDPMWYQAQRNRLYAGQPLPPPLPGLSATLPLTVGRVSVTGTQARVELIRLVENTDGKLVPFRLVAFYRYLPDGRWVHTAPDSRYGGRVLVWVGAHNDLAGYLVHTELMEPLASELELMSNAACALLRCPPGLRFQLALTGTLAKEESDPNVLPAPFIVGVPQGEAAYRLWLQTLKRYYVERVLEETIGQPTGGLIGWALRRRVHQLLETEPTIRPNVALLGEALAHGGLPSLAQLWNGRIAEDQRLVAENEALLFVLFTETHAGVDGVVDMLWALPEVSSIASLAEVVLNLSPSKFEQMWQDYLQQALIREKT